LWRVGAAGLAAAVLVVAGANTSIQHKPPAVLACLALRCRLAGVLVSVAFRAVLAVLRGVSRAFGVLVV
jgi:hypothetical protein